jgi:TP901 family phage tail tape measure protein
MARTSATISVGADTRQLERDIQSALSRDFKFKGLNEKAFTQPLGRITGAANEFQKSLDASNARVIAFGASAGIIYTIEKAFVELIKTTVNVQKSLTDINVILNTTSSGLAKFGANLFDIAKSTGQGFNEVAAAATELARQGLGVEETLKRTRDALILTRLSGLDTISSVEALTATINSFNKTALDSTTIVNKLANVDASFAVSSADLAEAVKRVGTSAQDAGVGFDELLAIVTSVQQTTARGGAVIGNSLKTIFTRIERPEVLSQLQALGIGVRDLEGNTLPAIQILKQLSTTFDTLSDSQKSQVAETVGGVFQINILKAALGDLGKEYSIYQNALTTANSATDQALKRNQALNETLAALFNRTINNVSQLGAAVGGGAFQPAIEGTLKNVNDLLEMINNQDTESVGSKIGQGILNGISTFISGPGVVLITAVIGKLLLNLSQFAASSTKALLGINQTADNRVQLQNKINQVLMQEPTLLAAIASKQIGVLSVENKILQILREQNVARAQASSLSSTITAGLTRRGVSVKGGEIRTASAGFIPSYAMSEIYGALSGGYKPGNVKEMNISGVGKTVYNSAETVKKFPGLSQPAIMPPSQSKAGKNYQNQFSSIHGFNPYASSGFIPNFAKNSLQIAQGYFSEAKGQNIDEFVKSKGYLVTPEVRKELDAIKTNPKKIPGEKKETVVYDAKKLGIVGVGGKRGTIHAQTAFATLGYTKDPRDVRFEGIQARTLEDLKGSAIQDKNSFSTEVNKLFVDPLARLANNIFGPLSPDPKFKSTLVSNTRKEGVNLFPAGTEGSIFEAAVNLGTKRGGALEKAFDQNTAQKPFDFEESSPPTNAFNSKFGFTPPVLRADAKRTITSEQAREIIDKAYRDATTRPLLPKPRTASSGFIPNFSALEQAVSREISAGVPNSKIRVGQSGKLMASSNPLGLGVYNTQDEPQGLNQGISRYPSTSSAKKAGSALGFIPNFAGQNIQFEQSAVSGMAVKDISILSNEVAKDLAKISKRLKAQEIDLAIAEKEAGIIAQSYQLTAQSTQKVKSLFTRVSTSSERFATYLSGLEREAAGAFGVFGGGKARARLERLANQQGSFGEASRATLDRAAQRRSAAAGRLQNAGLLASIAVPIVAQTVEQFAPENKAVRFGATVASDTAAFAGTGAIFGPYGAAIGGLVGVTIGLTKAFTQLKDKTEEYRKLTEQANANLTRFSEDVQTFLTNRETAQSIKSGESRGNFEAAAKARDEALTRIIASSDSDIGKSIVDAISSGSEQELQKTLGSASTALTSTKQARDFIDSINKLEPEKIKSASTFGEVFKQFNVLTTRSGQTLGSLISNNKDIMSSFEELTQILYTSKDATEALVQSMDPINQSFQQLENDLNNTKDLSKVLGARTPLSRLGISEQEVSSQMQKTSLNNIDPNTGFDINPALKDQQNLRKQAIKDLIDQKNISAINKFSGSLTGLIDNLISSGDFIPQIGEDIKREISKVLNSQLDSGGKAKELQKIYENLTNASEALKAAEQKRISTVFNLLQLEDRLIDIFNKDNSVRERGNKLLQKADFGSLVEDFLQTTGKQFRPNAVLGGAFNQGMSGVFGATVDDEKRLKYTKQLGEALKNTSASVTANGGKLTDEAFIQLQTAINDITTSAVMTQKSLIAISSSISDASLRQEVLNTYKEKESELTKTLGENITKLNFAIEATVESLIAEAKFREGTAFADEFKQARSGARDKAIRGGNYSPMDTLQSFQDEFAYGSQDLMKDLNNTASDTARTIKSEFNNAFQSVIEGTQTVGDAFSTMALNISKRIQQLALEMSTNMIFNSVFSSVGGISDIFKSPLGRKNGGLIKGYATGGHVVGGSGVRDDIPAYLSKGEYVIKKAAVEKYGKDFLDNLNSGRTVKKAGGGGFGVGSKIGDPNSYEKVNNWPIAMTSAGSEVLSERTDTGGAFSSDLLNDFYTTGATKYGLPTEGSYFFDPRLSPQAILDENNPMNQLRTEKVQRLLTFQNEVSNYDQYLADLAERNRQEKSRVDQLNQQNKDAYNKQQNNAFWGSLLQAGMAVGGGAFSQYGVPAIKQGFSDVFGGTSNQGWANWRGGDYSGGSMRFGAPGQANNYGLRGTAPTIRQGYAKGGSPYKDNVPALLMDGEYVVNKDTVSRYGKGFFDSLNSGRISKFADGGPVGNQNAGSNPSQTQSPVSNTNNINITVNVDKSSSTESTTANSQSNDKANTDQERRDELDKNRKLSDRIKSEVLKVLNTEQRPGGMLSSTKYTMKN